MCKSAEAMELQKQLTTCEWWVNYTTADRKFKYAHKECMAFTTGEVVGVAGCLCLLNLLRELALVVGIVAVQRVYRVADHAGGRAGGPGGRAAGGLR